MLDFVSSMTRKPCKALVALCCVSGFALHAAPVADPVAQAIVLRAQGQLTQSIELLERSSRDATSERDRMAAMGELGASQLQARHLDKAAQSLGKAYQYFSGVERARYAVDLGNLALLGKHESEARSLYEEALRLAGSDSGTGLTAQLNLARLVPEPERLRSLTLLYPAIARIQPASTRARMYLNVGAQAQALGKPGLELGFRGFDQARQLTASGASSRARVEALDGLAQLYEEQNRAQEALVLSRAGLQAAKDQAPGAVGELLVSLEWRVARLHTALGRHDLALAAYQRAADQLGPLRQDIPIDYDDGASSFKRTLEPIYLGLFEGLLRIARLQSGAERSGSLRRARDAIEMIKQSEMQDYLGDRCTVDTVKGGTATVIPEGTAVLYPVILADRVELLVETASDISHFSAPVAGDRIRRTAVLFANDLRVGAPGFLARSQQLYDWLLAQDLTQLDGAKIVANAPDASQQAAIIRHAFGIGEIAERAVAETRAKAATPDAHLARLALLAQVWPVLATRLRARLLPAQDMTRRLAAIGAPSHSTDIGVSRVHLRATIAKARYLRDRYTVLDLLDETGLLGIAIDAVFPAEKG